MSERSRIERTVRLLAYPKKKGRRREEEGKRKKRKKKKKKKRERLLTETAYRRRFQIEIIVVYDVITKRLLALLNCESLAKLF